MHPGATIFVRIEVDNNQFCIRVRPFCCQSPFLLKPSETCPSPGEMGLSECAQQMPPLITKFVEWLVDKNSYGAAISSYVLPHDILRHCVALAECIVSTCQNTPTPFQVGLAIQLHHEYGSCSLIDTLHSHGLCISYDELRRFITSVAAIELERIKDDTYALSGIIPISSGGSLIQEGDDNVDINTETIYGEDTFHSMARVVFQQQEPNMTDVTMDRIKRGQEKSLPVNADTESLRQCLHFERPHARPEPPCKENAMAKLKSCQDMPIQDSADMSWVLLWSVSHATVPFPPELVYDRGQVIPFWTGFDSMLSEVQETYTAVAYVPIIDAKPSDMSTIYTTMKRCKDMTSHLGQDTSIQTIDQQLYTVAQQVKWTAKEEFSSHILRLGGFHSLSCYIAAIVKLWADGGLRGLLVESEVYAGNTVDQMLSGKQFNHSMRGLTLAYEALSEVWLKSFFSWCELERKFNNKFLPQYGVRSSRPKKLSKTTVLMLLLLSRNLMRLCVKISIHCSKSLEAMDILGLQHSSTGTCFSKLSKSSYRTSGLRELETGTNYWLAKV